MSDTLSQTATSRAIILTVGTELTEGRISDAHGRFLSEQLRRLSFVVVRIVIIPDDRDRFVEEVRAASAAADLLLITGGLGPTSDDLTREVVAECAGVELQFAEDLWTAIKVRMGPRVSDTNRKQAFIPAGFDAIMNFNGTAPGFMGYVSRCLVAALPGPPHELQPMYRNQVADRVAASFRREIPGELAGTAFMTSESRLEELLQRHGRGNVSWGTRVDPRRIVFYLRNGSEDDRREMLDAMIGEAGSYRLRAGEVEAAELAFAALKDGSQTLATAESCTGGMVAQLVTDLPGSSMVFWGGWVVYANGAKLGELGVRAQTVEVFGAVSRETVCEMAAGALTESGSDIAVSVSGIAGPDGGSPDKPVGTVWIGVASRDGKREERLYQFRGDRSRVRRQSAVAALLMVEAIARGNVVEDEAAATA